MRLWLSGSLASCALVAALSPSQTQQPPVRATRHQFLSAAAAALVAGPALAAGALYPATQLVDELVKLRSDVRSGKLKSAAKVSAAKDRTLEPLRNAMEKNPLNDENAKLQPLLLKGHMLELDQALASPEGFAQYVSKTTGDTYPGGKVERELEEAVETAKTTAPSSIATTSLSIAERFVIILPAFVARLRASQPTTSVAHVAAGIIHVGEEFPWSQGRGDAPVATAWRSGDCVRRSRGALATPTASDDVSGDLDARCVEDGILALVPRAGTKGIEVLCSSQADFGQR
eukprot:CAMPEP_0197408318 /NCGR_PEP_ID=MMETSP1165-20131217/28264_1 /TAXON_ID=284809 /ORGANISM="Chrysocystis fragilis, Strain CCMP3189" /LENGTH=287 /DNA_ID=CAMNT_0042934745 /DNA_START=32 /DNA_END=897 /DNA_ORIENTATION=+